MTLVAESFREKCGNENVRSTIGNIEDLGEIFRQIGYLLRETRKIHVGDTKSNNQVQAVLLLPSRGSHQGRLHSGALEATYQRSNHPKHHGEIDTPIGSSGQPADRPG